MMDLSTIKENLKNGIYGTLEECFDDIQLIWDNCKLYNVEFSKIYKMAVRMEEFQKKIVSEYFPEVKSYGKNNESYKALEKASALNLQKNDPLVEE